MRRGTPHGHFLGQPLEQCVDPATRCAQARAQAVSLVGHRVELLAQQGVRAFEFVVAQQQALDTFGEVFELGHGLQV